MSDELNLGDEGNTEETPQQDPRDERIKRLEREAADAKTWARTEAAKRLSGQYGVEITPDRLKKVGDINTFEEILAQVKGTPAQTPTEGEPPKPQVSEGFDRLDATRQVATPGGTPETFTSDELLRRAALPPSDSQHLSDNAIDQIVREGRMT